MPTDADAGFVLQLQETAVSVTGAIVVYTDATEPIAFADGSQPENAPLLPPGTDPAVPASESQAAIDAGGVTVVDPVADAAAAAAADADGTSDDADGFDDAGASAASATVRSRHPTSRTAPAHASRTTCPPRPSGSSCASWAAVDASP